MVHIWTRNGWRHEYTAFDNIPGGYAIQLWPCPTHYRTEHWIVLVGVPPTYADNGEWLDIQVSEKALTLPYAKKLANAFIEQYISLL